MQKKTSASEKLIKEVRRNTPRMFTGWLTPINRDKLCTLRVLRPHSLCRFTTANAPANGTSRATVTANAHSLGR